MITLLNKFDDEYIVKEKDILDIAWSYARENRIENYLNDIVFDPKSLHIGDYDDDNIVTFNDQRLTDAVKELYSNLIVKHNIDGKYDPYFCNFFYLFMTFHEIDHIDQKARYENGLSNELFNYLYETCKAIIDKDYSFYKANHDLFPIEIEANNIGYLHAYNLMTHTKLPKREQRIMHLQYLKSLLHNYQKVSSGNIITPINKLAMLTSDIDLDKVNELMSKTKLSKIDRMNLGLNITSDEYDSVAKVRVSESIKVLKR